MKHFMSVVIIAPLLFVFLWMVYFFSHESFYEWKWEKIPSHFIDRSPVDVSAEFAGVIRQLTVDNGREIIEVVGGNQSKSYSVSASSIDVEEGKKVTKGQRLGTLTEARSGVLIEGLRTTIFASFLAIIFSVIIGLSIFSIYLHKLPYVNVVIIVILKIVKGIPIVWQILLGYFLLSLFLDYAFSFFGDFLISRLEIGILILSINSGVNIAYILINTNNANSPQNRNRKRTVFSTLWFRITDIVNESANTIKDSSLLSVIAISELTKTTKMAITSNFTTFEMALICCVMYIIVVNVFIGICTFLLSRLKFREQQPDFK